MELDEQECHRCNWERYPGLFQVDRKLLANLKKTLAAMDKPGFDYDGIDPTNARRELEEQIRRMGG